MTSDLEERLHCYRSTLDDAIVADMTQRAPSAGGVRSPRSRAVVGATAAVIAALGIGALAWTATNSRDRSEQSSDSVATAVVEGTDALVGAPATPPGQATTTVPGASATGTIERLAIGDNVMLGAAEQLAQLGFMVDAAEMRQFSDVVDLVTSLKDAGQLGNVVVIDSSTNGPIQSGDLDAVMSSLTDVANVYMLTDAIDRSWSQSNNELIGSLVHRYSNVTVIDWASEAAACPGDCFYSDNIHLRPDGQAFYAQLIQDATSEPATWTLEPGSVDASSNNFTAAVTRAGCSSGQTGTIYKPTVMVSDTDIVVTFRVEPLDPDFDYTCQDNDSERVAVTLPEPIGQRQLVDGACTELEGAACEFGAIRWGPDLTADPSAVSSDTILPPPLTVAEPAVVSLVEMDAIRNTISDRRTVALERADDGAVLWWMTAWTGSTASGVEVYCTGTLAGGQSCVPDINVELRHPVQVIGFSMQAPSALMLIAQGDVTSLSASIDDAEPIDIELVDIGVTSGKKLAGLYLGDAKNTVRFHATLVDGSTYTFGIKAPDVQTQPSTAPTGSSSPNEPYGPKELSGE